MDPLPQNRSSFRIAANLLKLSLLCAGFALLGLPSGAQQAPPEQAPPMTQQQEGPPQNAPEAQAPGQPNQAVPPQMLTLPAGTVIRIRVDEWLSSDRNVVGNNFTATLDQPVVADGWVVARRGQAQTGRVSVAKKAGHGNGTSQLGVELLELTLVDGQQLQLQTDLLYTSPAVNHGQDAAIVGTTTGAGAAIGAVAQGGIGAAVGAGIGATAGIIGVMVNHGRPTLVAPETVLTFRLQSPVTIATDRSQMAFQPVTQSDYDNRSAQNRPRLRRPGPPPPYYNYPYPYYAYPYPYGYYPPLFGFGIYGGYGKYGYWR